jgi:pyruvate ferredoxin oxidoreductase delta subunit
MNKPKLTKFINPKRIEDYTLGASLPGGHLVEKNSGWRTFRPIIDHKKCTFCLQCFLVCPDGVIDRSTSEMKIDYDFCKGCGICVKECKFEAITIVKEEG